MAAVLFTAGADDEGEAETLLVLRVEGADLRRLRRSQLRQARSVLLGLRLRGSTSPSGGPVPPSLGDTFRIPSFTCTVTTKTSASLRRVNKPLFRSDFHS